MNSPYQLMYSLLMFSYENLVLHQDNNLLVDEFLNAHHNALI